MFAVIETGGKQYIVSEKKKIKVEKIAKNEGDSFLFDKVMLIANGSKVEIGRPYIEKARVEAVVLKQARAKKIRILRYHSKTRRRRRKGHRQHYTELEIQSIKK